MIMDLDKCLHLDKDFRYKINKHKEYFKLPLKEIEKVIKTKYDKEAIFDYEVVDENWLLSQNPQ